MVLAYSTYTVQYAVEMVFHEFNLIRPITMLIVVPANRKISYSTAMNFQYCFPLVRKRLCINYTKTH